MYAQSYRWHMARASHWDEIHYEGELPFFIKIAIFESCTLWNFFRLFIELRVQYMKTTSSEHVVYTNWFLFWHSEQFMYTTCSELVVFMYWTRNSMNNLLSYCGLVDARISASEKDLPVPLTLLSPCTLLWLPSSSNVFLRKKHDCRLRSALSTTQAFETESRTK